MNERERDHAPEPSYYSVTPASVRYDRNLSGNAKLLYGEITALCSRFGYCWATNDYFAELYGTSTRTVQRWIKELVDANHITLELVYVEGSHEIDERRLRPNVMTPGDIFVVRGDDKSVVNNTKALNTNSDSSNRSRGDVNVAVQRRIWNDGIDLLIDSGKTEKNARSIIGLWVKDYGSAAVAECIAVAQAANAADAHAFLVKTLQTRFGKEGNNGTRNRTNFERSSNASAVAEWEDLIDTEG